MRRRMVLAAAAAGTVSGIGGCLSSVPGAGSALPRRVSFVSAETDAVELMVDVPEPMVTEQHPAQVRFTWTNPTTEPIQLILYRDVPEPQASRSGDTYRTGLVLLPPKYDAEQAGDGCWRPSELRGRGAAPNLPLETDETLSHTYEVWTDPDESGCFPVGQYQFGTLEEGWQAVLAVEDG